MVKITLHLSSSLYSLTQVLLAAGALCGGILAGILAPKLSLRNMHWVLLLASLCLLPIGISLALGASIMVSYVEKPFPSNATCPEEMVRGVKKFLSRMNRLFFLQWSICF